MAQLASDLDNKQFTGAMNPDDALYVEFYWHTPIDKWESDTQQKRVNQKVMKLNADGKTFTKTDEDLKIPYVRIMTPGNNNNVIEVPVREDHKIRFAQRWLAWQIREGIIDGGGKDIPGWNIDDWDEVNKNPEQLRELHHLRFHTVEMIAGASDAQLQRMGMGGQGLREKARVAVRNKMGSETAGELAKRDAEIAELRKMVESLLPKAAAAPKKDRQTGEI